MLRTLSATKLFFGYRIGPDFARFSGRFALDRRGGFLEISMRFDLFFSGIDAKTAGNRRKAGLNTSDLLKQSFARFPRGLRNFSNISARFFENTARFFSKTVRSFSKSDGFSRGFAQILREDRSEIFGNRSNFIAKLKFFARFFFFFLNLSAFGIFRKGFSALNRAGNGRASGCHTARRRRIRMVRGCRR